MEVQSEVQRWKVYPLRINRLQGMQCWLPGQFVLWDGCRDSLSLRGLQEFRGRGR